MSTPATSRTPALTWSIPVAIASGTRLDAGELADPLALLDDHKMRRVRDRDQRNVGARLQAAALVPVSPISSLSPKATTALTPDAHRRGTSEP